MEYIVLLIGIVILAIVAQRIGRRLAGRAIEPDPTLGVPEEFIQMMIDNGASPDDVASVRAYNRRVGRTT